MKISIRSMVMLLAVVAIVLPVMLGCAPQAKPVTTTPTTPTVKKPAEIIIYDLSDISGPYSGSMAPSVAGFADFFKWYNAKGGLDGVKVQLEWADTGGDKAKALTQYSKIRESKPAFMVINSGNDAEMLAPRLAEDKIPGYTASANIGAIWPPQWIFSELAAWSDLSGAVFNHLSAEWAKSGKSEKCRVAAFNPDVALAKDITSPEVMEYLKTKPNIEIISTDYFDPKAIDLSSDITKVMQKNPDYIYGFYFATYGIAFYKSIGALGLPGKVGIITTGWGMQPELVPQYGKQNIEGVWGPHSMPPFLPAGMPPSTPGMVLVDQLYTENNRPATMRTSGYSNCVSLGFLFTHFYDSAVKKVGWDGLNGQAVYDVIINTSDYNCGDIQSWGVLPGTRTGNKYQIQQFKDGLPLPAGEWKAVPDIRPAKYRTAEYGWTAAGWPAGSVK